MKLLNGECAEELSKLQADSVALTVTSPPYDDLRTYDGYVFDFEKIAAELFRVTKPGGAVVWIVADATKNGSETGTSFKQALGFMAAGFGLHDTMIWQKSAAPYQHANRYISCFEYMFVLSKGPVRTHNLIRDRKNACAGDTIHGTGRQADGSLPRKSGDKTGKLVKEYGARFNIWPLTEVKTKSEHPATFPIALARDHILTWSNPGDVILDPFLGSGTTGVAAIELDRHFIGIEVSPRFFELAVSRIAEAFVI